MLRKTKDYEGAKKKCRLPSNRGDHTWARRGSGGPQPPDPIVVTYELYVVDPPPPLAIKIRGVRAQL